MWRNNIPQWKHLVFHQRDEWRYNHRSLTSDNRRILIAQTFTITYITVPRQLHNTFIETLNNVNTGNLHQTCSEWLASSGCMLPQRHVVHSRDVMKFKFEFNNVLTFLRDSKCCCRMRIRGKILVLQLISYAQQEVDCCKRAQTNFSLKFNYLSLLNYSYWMCNIIVAQWCVTLYYFEHWLYWH